MESKKAVWNLICDKGGDIMKICKGMIGFFVAALLFANSFAVSGYAQQTEDDLPAELLPHLMTWTIIDRNMSAT